MNDAIGKDLTPAIGALPAALRSSVELWAERFRDRNPTGLDSLDAATLRPLLRLVACSEFAGHTIIREWPWFSEVLAKPGAEPDLRFELSAADPETDDIKTGLRRFRNQRLLHILWRETTGRAATAVTLESLSKLADNLIAASVQCAEARLNERCGRVRDSSGKEQRLVVLAMGKLGGCELNVSSDIDLIFLYSGDGESDGERRLSAQEYFTRLSRQVVAMLEEVTPDGFAYRVDTRLRPFGDSGPPVLSFSALESYLLRHGRSWERYAYVKARVIATSPAREAEPVTAELMKDIIEPFVYRRYLDYGVFESLREMKALIAAEARKRQLAPNIKLGPGGIREIEFIAQSLQLVRGGSDRNLRTTGLQPALRHLAQTRGLSAAAAAELATAYLFLRRVENALQAMRDQQVHELPKDPADRARLALAVDYPDWDALHASVERYRRCVSKHFSAVAFRGGDEKPVSGFVDALSASWSARASEEEWRALLEQSGFVDAPAIASIIVGFARSAAVGQVDRTGAKRLAQFVPELLGVLREHENAPVVLQRVLAVLEKILRRSAYVALLIENPAVRDRLVGLCEKSAWLAEEIGRYPLLLDELLDRRLHEEVLTREEMQQDLDRRFDRLAETDSERLIESLGQFQRAMLFRIAVADIAGNLPVMKVSDRLTELAEIVLQKALAIAWRDMTDKHGRPPARSGRGDAGFGVVAYGKFGGMELSYRSDLDLVFLHDSTGDAQETDGEKPLDNNMFFARLVRRLVHFLSAQTATGAMYQVDTRLRPSGQSGLLVTSIEAFERYQEENAWTWEHQALLRSRFVAGSALIAREFERVRNETLRKRVRRDRLRQDVIAMRHKMRERLDKTDNARFDLKQGTGGIADIEFIVQYLVLEHAERHPAVIHYPDNIRQLGTLAAANCLPAEQVTRIQGIYKSYRLRLHRLALDEQPPFVEPGEFRDERRFVEVLWQQILGEPGA
ncbi:MAG TPA: bifunctional [glutamate--ammonia ligase]-adenylyl-L-tyrosine phosphorylase/[glutamate--ammonia-ligase] adenylyltransferase [Woeseiaceae bacterium]|nr:bifunctional [glutamate--ammonia ligase]-adenylyl-L-tyrosine phosphorylase/[glutamate--ammonia-ligase] adenylyltransferase [Woeseiaceae bacterium]